MRLGLGIGVNRKTPVSAFSFDSALAEAYFAEEEVQGFTEAQSQSLYSLDFDTIKGVVDTLFSEVSVAVPVFPNAFYPEMGGTSATHAINGADVSKFTITWIGSPIHSATGVKFNGTNQYGKTGLIASVDLILNDTSISVYTQADVPENARDMGSQNSTSQRILFDSNRGDGKILCDMYRSTARINGGVSGDGHILVSRRAANDMEAYRNKISQATTASGGGTLSTFEMYIGAFNMSGAAFAYSSKEHSFGHIGPSMTSVQGSGFYDAIQKFQTSLGRAV